MLAIVVHPAGRGHLHYWWGALTSTRDLVHEPSWPWSRGLTGGHDRVHNRSWADHEW